MTFPDDPKRALIVGDTHGDGAFVRSLAPLIAAANVDVVIQLGDFGWYPRIRRGLAFAHDVQATIRATGVPWAWIDGNHDDHEWLRLADQHPLYIPYGDPNGRIRYHRTGGTGPFEVATGIWHIPRGYTWTWGTHRFGALGGGYSINRAEMMWGRDWFDTETLQPGDVDRVLQQKPVDVLFAHDVPDWVPIEGEHFGYKSDIPESEAHRRIVGVCVEHLRPNLLVHGHYHHRYTLDNVWRARLWGGMRVEGISKNRHPGCVAIMDLTTLEVTDTW
jgi:hypothetical protein